MSEQFDIVVIGGGPGGYVAAIRAAQLKMKVALVEREHLGGICLNWGCIPTKALLKASEINHLLHSLDEYGFSAKDISFDFKKVIERSRNVSKKLTGGIGHLLKKNKVTVFDGTAKLKLPGAVTVEKDGQKQEVKAKHIIIATGARARVLPNIPVDGKLVWSYKEALVPDIMPKSLLVVGSGAIGSEFASFYLNMGAQVTLVEVVDRILPAEDEEISGLAKKAFEKQGMKVLVSTTVKSIKPGKDNVEVTLEAGGKEEKIIVDRVISAVGIVGNSENIGLEGTKVKTDRGHIVVGPYLETDEKGVYAIGDVVSGPWLAHKASHEAIICVEKIAGSKDVHPLDKSAIPGCTYCRPQVASVGLTEAKAKAAGHTVKVGRFPFMANGKALALGEPDGLVKTVFDAKTGELLGAHMIGTEVTEMIQGYTIAKNLESTEKELMHTVFAHPTLSEMMHESVLDAYGQAIHI